MSKRIFSTTQRGFPVWVWSDLNDEACSLQKSSLATDDAVWVGLNTGTHVRNERGEVVCCARMHLDREQAKWLAERLLAFALTGEVTK